MEKIAINISKKGVIAEVAKITDYTGSKMVGEDEGIRDRILASDAELEDMNRFWDECVVSVNENFKEILISGRSRGEGDETRYEGEMEVSKSFDKELRESVESSIRSFFILSMAGQWFKFTNREECENYFLQAGEMMSGAERMLYSRKRPIKPREE